MKKTQGGAPYFIFIVILGAISGTLLGDILGSHIEALSILKLNYEIGINTPLLLNLKFIVLTIGLSCNVNIMSIVGIILAIIIYKKF
ncbi:MAG: DUF4321 domain-containing protein [Clostridium sp.]